jgi:pilus assembly protein CpaB
MAAILPQGMRAVSTEISAETGAGGFILPNDRVDVIHTVAEDKGGGQSVNVSRTILTNVRVLAIDQQADDTSKEAVAIGKTATLELTPEQAEEIAAAEASGSLSLALRSTADNDEAPLVRQDNRRVVRIIRAGATETFEIPRDRN